MSLLVSDLKSNVLLKLNQNKPENIIRELFHWTTQMSSIDDLVRRLRVITERAAKKVEDVSRKAESKLGEMAPKIDSGIRDFAANASDAFSRAMESSAKYATREQIELLKAYKGLLEKQLQLIESRTKTLRGRLKKRE